MGTVVNNLSQELGRSPTIPEIAQRAEVSVDEVLEAMEAGRAYRFSSIDAPAGDEDLVVRQVPAVLLGPVEEQELAEAGALDALEELLGDDLVGVDVGAPEDADGAGDGLDRSH